MSLQAVPEGTVLHALAAEQIPQEREREPFYWETLTWQFLWEYNISSLKFNKKQYKWNWNVIWNWKNLSQITPLITSPLFNRNNGLVLVSSLIWHTGKMALYLAMFVSMCFNIIRINGKTLIEFHKSLVHIPYIFTSHFIQPGSHGVMSTLWFSMFSLLYYYFPLVYWFYIVIILYFCPYETQRICPLGGKSVFPFVFFLLNQSESNIKL